MSATRWHSQAPPLRAQNPGDAAIVAKYAAWSEHHTDCAVCGAQSWADPFPELLCDTGRKRFRAWTRSITHAASASKELEIADDADD